MGIPVHTPTSSSVAGSSPPRGASPGGPGTWWARGDGGSASNSVVDGLFVGSWDGRASSIEHFGGGSFTTPARMRSRTGSMVGGGPATPAPVVPVPVRVEGIKRVGCVAVGEKHSLALQTWCRQPAGVVGLSNADGMVEMCGHNGVPLGSVGTVGDDDVMLMLMDGVSASPRQYGEDGSVHGGCEVQKSSSTASRGAPALQSICQAAIARDVIDPRNVLHVLEYAESLGAAQLRAHCMLMVVANFDAVVGEARAALEVCGGGVGSRWMHLQVHRNMCRTLCSPYMLCSPAFPQMLSPHLVCEIERLYKTRLQPPPVGAPQHHQDVPFGGMPHGDIHTPDASLDALLVGDTGTTTSAVVEAAKTMLQPGSRPTRVAVEHHDDDAEEMLLEAASLARCRLHESTQAALRAAMAGVVHMLHPVPTPAGSWMHTNMHIQTHTCGQTQIYLQ